MSKREYQWRRRTKVRLRKLLWLEMVILGGVMESQMWASGNLKAIVRVRVFEEKSKWKKFSQEHTIGQESLSRKFKVCISGS